MTLIGTVTRVETIASSSVAVVACPSVAPGYTVGPCELADHLTGVATGDRVVVAALDPEGTTFVVLARLPAL